MGIRKMFVAGGLVLALAGAACSSSGGNGGTGGSSFSGVPITGAGSSFAAPIYQQWGKDFNGVESGAQVNYQSIGSGGGVDAFTKQTVDFGASDAPLQSDQTSALPGTAVEIPTVLGGVAVAYNVSGLNSGLKLDGATIADIFAGNITMWNDPKIAAQNSGMTLPSTPIKVVHRSDDSGTTFVFTNWLSGQSASWESSIGAGTTVQWPTGGAGKDGSDGVAGYLKQTDGSIGYIAYDYAVANNFGVASVKAKGGDYIAPSVDTISAAGSALSMPVQSDANVLNVPGAYPIATTTYVLVYVDQANKDKGQTLVDFLHWGLTKGQQEVGQLNYAPLPAGVAQKALSELAKVSYQGKSITPSSGA